MTTTPAPAHTAGRSRLDPEPIARRDFLGFAAVWSAIITAAFALIGAGRLPRAAVVPVPSRKFRVALPAGLGENEPFVPPGRAVAIFRDGEGVYAVSQICTHLGCVVKTDADGFNCPCHGSRFAPNGKVVKGPAPKALAWLQIARIAPDTYLVDEAKQVAAGTKVTA